MPKKKESEIRGFHKTTPYSFLAESEMVYTSHEQSKFETSVTEAWRRLNKELENIETIWIRERKGGNAERDPFLVETAEKNNNY